MKPPRPDWRRSAVVTTALALVLGALTFLAVGCGGGSESDGIDPGNAAEAPDFSEAIEAARGPLADLYEPGGVILAGGLAAYEQQIADLRGHPIVVNKWASWCGPCRAEFPYFQNQAAAHADEVAFLGIDSNDSEDAAETFLRDHPIPYPSFFDPEQDIAESIDAAFAFPTTVFYDAEGEIVHRRQGEYASEEELAADIERYAFDG